MNNQKVLISVCVIILQFDRATNHLDLHPVEDNAIITSESKIRETIINILDLFNITGVISVMLNEHLTIHNNLLSVALEDQDNFREIVKLTRLNISNLCEDFIRSVNEITNEDNEFKITEIFDNSIILNITNDFLNEVDLGYKAYSKEIYLETVKRNEEILIDTNTKEDSIESSDESNEVEPMSDSTLTNVTSANIRRIYKGKKTKIKYFPFLASILIFQKFYCAGSIVSADLIITAASCLQESWSEKLFRENPTFLSVRVGSTSPSRGGDVIPVSEVFFNPTYNKKDLKDNLCLLKLASILKFSSKKKSVRKINFDGQRSHLSKRSGSVTVIGWGNKNHHNKTLKSHLSYAKLKIISLQKCKDTYKEQYIKKRPSFCAGSSTKSKGACEHDVGDPGLVNGILTGVVSFGSPTCGHSNTPIVFTKLGYYSHWIEEIIEQSATKETTQRHSPTTEKQTVALPEENAETIPSANLMKSFLRKNSTSKIFKVTDFPDSAQPPPIYIADGVKSILYNNEYNIYLDKAHARQRDSITQFTDSDKDSEETLDHITSVYDKSSVETDKTTQPTKVESTTKKDKTAKKHKSKSTTLPTTTSTKFTPNSLINWESIKHDFMNNSLANIDKMKHDKKKHDKKKHDNKKHDNKKHDKKKHDKTKNDKKAKDDKILTSKSTKNSNHTTSSFNKTKTTFHRSKSRHKDAHIKHAIKSLHEFLKSSKNPKTGIDDTNNDGLKDFIHKMSTLKLKNSNSEQTDINKYALSLTTFKNWDVFDKPGKISPTPQHHFEDSNNFMFDKTPFRSNKLTTSQTTHLLLHMSSGEMPTRPTKSTIQSYDDDVIKSFEQFDVNDYNMDPKAQKVIYDYPQDTKNVKNNYFVNEFETEELLNKNLEKAPQDSPHIRTVNDEYYQENYENNADEVLSHVVSAPLQYRKSRPLKTTKENKITFIKSDNIKAKSILSVARAKSRKITNNLHNVDVNNASRATNMLSEDYVFSLIEKAVDEVEQEIQKNNSLLISKI